MSGIENAIAHAKRLGVVVHRRPDGGYGISRKRDGLWFRCPARNGSELYAFLRGVECAIEFKLKAPIKERAHR